MLDQDVDNPDEFEEDWLEAVHDKIELEKISNDNCLRHGMNFDWIRNRMDYPDPDKRIETDYPLGLITKLFTVSVGV